jgi:nucleotide-binding universal stress UspA family protein
MMLAVRPLLRRLSAMVDRTGRLSQNLVAIVFLLVLASAVATDAIGIHAIFGGFMMGAIMPKDALFTRELVDKLEDFAVVFLLPIYFAYTGLRTQIGLVDTPALWLELALVIGVATAGKFGGSALAARLTGLGWREACALGVLMNTRGLMELIILNIGFDLGVLSPALFAMMVLMAIVTTLATTPILAALYPAERFRAELAAAPAAASGVLAAVALPSSGPLLLDVAATLAEDGASPLYVLHLERPPERGTLGVGVGAESTNNVALAPTLEHASRRGLAVRPLQFVSRNPSDDIRDVARAKGAGLVVMGWHKPVWTRTVLGGTVKAVMREADADVAVFIDRGLAWPPRRVLVPFAGTGQDRAALRLATRIATRLGATLTMLGVVRPGGELPRVELPEPAPPVRVVESTSPIDAVLAEAAAHDLTVLGVGEGWQLEPNLFGLRSERLAAECPSSLLVVRGHAERRDGAP